MAELKTKVNDVPVADFLNAIPDPQARQDCWDIAKIMEAATKAKPKMWGAGIVGFGEHKEWMIIAFAPRKDRITLYIGGGFDEYEDLVSNLRIKARGKGCLHFRRLSDLHMPTLKKLVRASVKHRKSAD